LEAVDLYGSVWEFLWWLSNPNTGVVDLNCYVLNPRVTHLPLYCYLTDDQIVTAIRFILGELRADDVGC